MDELLSLFPIAVAILSAVASGSAMWTLANRSNKLNTAEIKAIKKQMEKEANAIDDRVNELEHWRSEKRGHARGRRSRRPVTQPYDPVAEESED